ncbi:helix-turn-helix domain-containing protein [Gordonia sp. TBRC 11910]|uniref:Helix-turn-helix domain-containing protein n=1 Tax=Gordonia asplenii TaxID=2725283 RepID=A0A848KZ33_9ACTN|nr:LuxR C-terminal-related transcriptional regulator [Gordonia asplenii]NMO03472.1 helix-turn-helix domain-containing protein [Gordonia asplenii]
MYDVSVPCPAITPTTPVVAVIAEHDILDDAVVALVEKLGFVAVVHDVESPDARRPGYAVVVITRSPHRYEPLAASPAYRLATIVGIGVSDGQPASVGAVATAAATTKLSAVLSEACRHHPQMRTPRADPDPSPPEGRVHLTSRELEVLGTYVFGKTIGATARAHTISESTVREHYRRVKQRYEDAGRPVGNKAQLLLALVDDGWLHTKPAHQKHSVEWRDVIEGT